MSSYSSLDSHSCNSWCFRRRSGVGWRHNVFSQFLA